MRRRKHLRGRRLANAASLASLTALTMLAAACSGGHSGSGHAGHHASQAAASHVTITPANGTTNADPSAGITLTGRSLMLLRCTRI